MFVAWRRPQVGSNDGKAGQKARFSNHWFRHWANEAICYSASAALATTMLANTISSGTMATLRSLDSSCSRG